MFTNHRQAATETLMKEVKSNARTRIRTQNGTWAYAQRNEAYGQESRKDP